MTKHGTLVKLASLGLLSLGLATDSAHAFSIISFNGKAARWNRDTPLQIEMDPNFGTQFSKSGCDNSGACVTPLTAVQRSVNAWKDVAKVNIQVNAVKSKTISSTPSYDGHNQIKFYGNEWETLPFSPPSSALAVTISTYGDDGTIQDADIFVNGKYFQWGVVNSVNENNVHDIQNVITHEMGHFFGLDHTSNNPNETDTSLFNATMYFASYPGETSRQTLENQDIYGIQHLYTTEDIESPSVDTVSPNHVEVSYKGSVTLEIDGDGFLPMTSVVIARAGNENDVIGRIMSIDSNKIKVAFDVSDLQSGQYNLVVANSYNKFSTVEKGFSIQNHTVSGVYSAESAAASTGSSGCQSNGSSALLLFLLPVLFVLPKRFKQES